MRILFKCGKSLLLSITTLIMDGHQPFYSYRVVLMTEMVVPFDSCRSEIKFTKFWVTRGRIASL